MRTLVILGLVLGCGGAVVANRRAALNGNPGLEAEIRFPDATLARVRYSLVGHRVYEQSFALR